MEYIYISDTDIMLLEGTVKDNREHINNILADKAMVDFIDKKDFKSFFDHIKDEDRAPFTALFILSNIDFLEGLDYIPSFMFCNLSVSDIKLPSNIKFLGNNCFQDSSILTFESSCEDLNIGTKAFDCCSFLLSVKVEGITRISTFAFSHCPRIVKFKVNSLDDKAFGQPCFGGYIFSGSYITKIDFGGSKQEWKDAKKDSQWRHGSRIMLIKCSDGDIHHKGNL